MKSIITLKLHYFDRADNDYTDWNAWVWADTKGGAQHDFTEIDETGGRVATFTLDGHYTNTIWYRIRKGDWKENDPDEMNRSIDVSDVLSGTVHFYVPSKNPNGSRRVLGEDAVIGAKILKAWYDRATNKIKVTTGVPIEANTEKVFSLRCTDGTEIAIANAAINKNQSELTLATDLTGTDAVVKSYLLTYDGYDYLVDMPNIYSKPEFEDIYTYDGGDLGATWSKEKTTFKVWAPTADDVKLNLYRTGTPGENTLLETVDLEKGEKGVWSVVIEGNCKNKYYTYCVNVGGKVNEACDPYARTTGVNGKRAMVIDLESTNPKGWEKDFCQNPKMQYTDAIIYELHVRDLSMDRSSGISKKNQGKFLGLTERGTTNASGQPTGLDHILDLGVTHVHLLPSYDYGSVDEAKLDQPQFNWGYDPVNYNVPEGSYSTDPYDGNVRVREMKQMIKALHDNQIQVVMDVVYNHVYDAGQFCFNQIVPKYFSRTNADGSYSNGSYCGNDTASERSMVKKYIVDSVNYWADEYHIDGFRFDLVGLLDTETIHEIVSTVQKKHPHIIFYGEGWFMNTAVSKMGYDMAVQGNAPKTPNFAYFSDTIRDLLKGKNEENARGFVSGLKGQEEAVAYAFKGSPWWTNNPSQVVNYVSCHDNHTLKDKLDISRKDTSEEERVQMNKLAAAIYLTAQGIPLLHAGEEILRKKVDENGNIIENSYNASDYVNSIKWSSLDSKTHQDVRDYYKGLIAFRKSHAALRLTTAEQVNANVQYLWVTNEVVMFHIKGKDSVRDEISDGIIVIFNANNCPMTFNLYEKGISKQSEGEMWQVCVNGDQAGTKILGTISDGNITVEPISALILVKGNVKEDVETVVEQRVTVEKADASVEAQGQEEKVDVSVEAQEREETTDAIVETQERDEKTDASIETQTSFIGKCKTALKNKLSNLLTFFSKHD